MERFKMSINWNKVAAVDYLTECWKEGWRIQKIMDNRPGHLKNTPKEEMIEFFRYTLEIYFECMEKC